MLALVVYDYLISIQDEVSFVWHRKFSFASVILVVNRYSVVLYGIFNFLSCYSKVRDLLNDDCQLFIGSVLRGQKTMYITTKLALTSRSSWTGAYSSPGPEKSRI